jgi:1-acyl-sn-glycerol-3-phosphate acyltransferase
MSFLGVVPIDRTQKGGVVEQGIEYFNSVDKTIILVTPEGTRSYRKDWKSGFYHIAG